jgi:hypothetical protein
MTISHVRRVLPVAALLAATALVAFAQQPATPPAPSGTPDKDDSPHIEVSSTDWDFGEVWQGTEVAQEFTIRNTGAAPLTIDVRSSCGCTTPTPPKSPLAPGATDTMTISYATHKRIGRANQTVTLLTNDPAQPSVKVHVRGNVKRVLKLDPIGGFNFGRVYASEAATQTVELSNEYDEKIRVELAQDGNPKSLDLRIEELEPGRRWRVFATTKPPLPDERFSTNVVIHTTAKPLPTLRLPVTGVLRPPILLSGTLLFPTTLATPYTRWVRLEHAPETPIRIRAINKSHPAIEVTSEPIEQDGAPAGYKVGVTWPAAGTIPADADAWIEIRTNADDPQYRTIRVPIRLIQPRTKGR